jgi:hypothetical protein
MKKLYTLLLVVVYISLSASTASSQCSGSYISSQLNWDNLDYYYNSSSASPYGSYITDAREQTQRFAVGRNSVTMVTSSASLVTTSENTTHTGEITNYTGADVQYDPSANGQNIVLTFTTPVYDPNFTLYDIDENAVFTITATNDLLAATTVNVTTYTSSILTVGAVPLTRTITATNTALGTAAENRGSATITVPGLVKTITITVTTRGNNPVFWLSDINACVDNGSFPTNWHQLANNRPFVGPTQNMPDYFLDTPDSDSTYYIDPTTGYARFLFRDNTRDYVNSFAYDPYNRYLYYITENVSVNSNNKALKRYDYNTETYTQIVADITAAPLSIPTFNMGVESAGAAFYDGALYLGVEGGQNSTSSTRETIIWRIDFDGSQNVTGAYQVFATDAYESDGSPSYHDWGDFIMKNGMIYDFNTARNGSSPVSYVQSKYHHYNLVTGQVTVYAHPGLPTLPTSNQFNGQAGMTWAGDLYYCRDSVGKYNEDGTNDAASKRDLVIVDGPYLWPGGSGDASDPFRPKCDFGDAPATYDPYADPSTQSPAVHERADNIWLGTTTSEATSWSREFLKLGVTGTEDADNGISTLQFMEPGGGDYLSQVSFYNNSGANATIQAWLDYNADGVFDASEAATIYPATAIGSSASVQTRYLYWPGMSSPLTNGQSTYLRVRITSASAGMTTSHPTGYFTNGEVEDYRVLVDNFPLATHLVSFNASLVSNNKVKLSWTAAEDQQATIAYEIQRSNNNMDWTVLKTIDASGAGGNQFYETEDLNPLKGTSYYRLHILASGSGAKYSEIRSISIKDFDMSLTVSPNPVKDKINLRFETNHPGDAQLSIVDAAGKIVFSGKYTANSGTNFITLPVTDNLANGSYIVRMQMGTDIVNQKLIINK